MASASTCLRFAAVGFAESNETWIFPFDLHLSRLERLGRDDLVDSRRPQEHADVVAERLLERLLDLRGHVARRLEDEVPARPEAGHVVQAELLEDRAQLGAADAPVLAQIDGAEEGRVPHAISLSKSWSSVAAGRR